MNQIFTYLKITHYNNIGPLHKGTDFGRSSDIIERYSKIFIHRMSDNIKGLQTVPDGRV